MWRSRDAASSSSLARVRSLQLNKAAADNAALLLHRASSLDHPPEPNARSPCCLLRGLDGHQSHVASASRPRSYRASSHPDGFGAPDGRAVRAPVSVTRPMTSGGRLVPAGTGLRLAEHRNKSSQSIASRSIVPLTDRTDRSLFDSAEPNPLPCEESPECRGRPHPDQSPHVLTLTWTSGSTGS
jgi:hypothetical protein